MAQQTKDKDRYRQVAQNRRARRDYFIDEQFEAGLVLTGTEVKSLREGHANIRAARSGYATPISPNTPTPPARTTSRAGRASCCSRSARSRS